MTRLRPSWLTLLLLPFFAPLVSQAANVSKPGYIAVVAAFPGEMESLRRIIEGETIDRVERINGAEFHIGKAYGKDVIFFITGVSTVNAAMTTQLALSNYDVEVLLFSGIAGGINPALEMGDVAIPAEWHYHAEGAYFNEDPENPGEFIRPETFRDIGPNFGMHHPRPVRAVRKGLTERIVKPTFSADADLLELSRVVTAELEMDNALDEPVTFKIGGVGTAGPVFMDNREYRKWLFESYQIDSLDMESTAIAHVCWSNQVPFLIVRCMSDLAGGQEGVNQIHEFGPDAQDNAAETLAAILEAM
ncbi:MAG: 5'-methylthioadenosine/S-adenosylhomocysteine nucleosidase [Opitutales bacterium]